MKMQEMEQSVMNLLICKSMVLLVLHCQHLNMRLLQ